jgi:hypothetical protein
MGLWLMRYTHEGTLFYYQSMPIRLTQVAPKFFPHRTHDSLQVTPLAPTRWEKVLKVQYWLVNAPLVTISLWVEFSTCANRIGMYQSMFQPIQPVTARHCGKAMSNNDDGFLTQKCIQRAHHPLFCLHIKCTCSFIEH